MTKRRLDRAAIPTDTDSRSGGSSAEPILSNHCYPAMQMWSIRRFNAFLSLWGILTVALLAILSAIQATSTGISAWLLIICVALELPFIVLLTGWVALGLSNWIENWLHRVHHPLSSDEVSTLAELMDTAADKLESQASDVAKHWAKHFRQSCQLLAIDPLGGASMFRSAFGGMGSYNDWNGVENKSDSDEIDALVGSAAKLADRLIHHGFVAG